MKMRTHIVAAASALILVACGGGDSKPEEDGDASSSSVTTEAANNSEASETPPIEGTDTPKPQETPAEGALLKRGRIAFLRCRSCHTLDEGGAHLTGPNLYGFYNQPAATKDYAYSDELKGAGITWDDASLDAWLKSPSTFLPGNRMVFAGLPRAEDRAALIAYLEQETK